MDKFKTVICGEFELPPELAAQLRALNGAPEEEALAELLPETSARATPPPLPLPRTRRRHPEWQTRLQVLPHEAMLAIQRHRARSATEVASAVVLSSDSSTAPGWGERGSTLVLSRSSHGLASTLPQRLRGETLIVSSPAQLWKRRGTVYRRFMLAACTLLWSLVAAGASQLRARESLPEHASAARHPQPIAAEPRQLSATSQRTDSLATSATPSTSPAAALQAANADPGHAGAVSVRERAATDALAAGDASRAARLYARLAQQAPTQRAYSEAARILAARAARPQP